MTSDNDRFETLLRKKETEHEKRTRSREGEKGWPGVSQKSLEKNKRATYKRFESKFKIQVLVLYFPRNIDERITFPRNIDERITNDKTVQIELKS